MTTTIYVPPKVHKTYGHRDKSLSYWSEDMLVQLRTLCQAYASWDDLNAAFPGAGMSRVMMAMRHLIAVSK